ncbi:MAG: aldehyde dehydrogenase family protein [Acidimicrobiales bacterium]
MSPAKKTATKAATKAAATRSTKPSAPVDLDVRKTYKLYIGGAFPRSESGRSYPVVTTDRRFVANAVLASRKDVRDAVQTARNAQGSWAKRSAYNRGQILYRVAEIMQGRRQQFVDELSVGGSRDAQGETDAAIDRWVWYAGWADKYAQILGSANPVDGPYFNFTTPEPAGVVALVAPNDAPLLALVSRLAPAIVAGNTTVALASERWPLVSITLAEALATSDVPGGVVNILTGKAAELVPWMAGHADVNVVDLSGVNGELRADAERRASDAVTRVVAASAAERRWFDDRAESPYIIAGFCEYKTVWHPKGA